MFKFIYSKRDEDIYRIRTIFGIKIITKPLELRIARIENRIVNIENKILDENKILRENNMYNNIQNELYKLEVYKLFANNKEKKVTNIYEHII